MLNIIFASVQFWGRMMKMVGSASVSARPSFLRIVASVAVIGGLQFPLGAMATEAPSWICLPAVSPPVIVATLGQRRDAGAEAQPPLTDTNNGFAWPDTPIGIIKTGNAYTFFASDGGYHAKQELHGQIEPRQVCRRLVSLSHAAMARVSI